MLRFRFKAWDDPAAMAVGVFNEAVERANQRDYAQAIALWVET